MTRSDTSIYCTTCWVLRCFPWSAIVTLEPQHPSQCSPSEMVTQTLVQELDSLLKHTECLRQERAAKIRRQLLCGLQLAGNNTAEAPYQIMAEELLELQELCLKIPSFQSEPIVLK
ncbi:hypothetical protein HF521_005667 [Silurus meridionalis]|uniref:Uncharacterized protein n=1 Tax=Silurus meridionalis TaxID=175797 RepID=A0A8T0AY13_SILME|nr:hypothetical protein HF521_005667 [Silurus meridionalis]